MLKSDIKVHQKFACVTWAHYLAMKQKYRKVASSRPVYYSILNYFWGATN